MEDYDEIMRDYYSALAEWEAEDDRINDRIFKVLEARNGKTWLKELKQLIEDGEIHGRFSLVRKPQGEKQPTDNEFVLIQNEWVRQWTVGDGGDSYSGFVSVLVKPGMWLEMSFSM